MSKRKAQSPRFFGYFSAVTDGTLISLLRTSMPGDPVRERLGDGLAEMRFLALDSLESPTQGGGHAAAVQVVEKAVAAGKPFGLYLRNFDLVARTASGAVDRYGEPQLVTLGSSTDVALQHLVAEQAANRLPFVGIENHSADGGPFPRFVSADKHWEKYADILIRHAAVFVVFYLGLTPGVVREFDMLRKAGAQSRTLVVVGGEAPWAFSGPTGAIFALVRMPAGEELPAPPPVDPPPADFSQVVTLPSSQEPDDATRRAIDVLIATAAAHRPSPRTKPIRFPPEFRPARSVVDQARALALYEVKQAKDHDSAGELVEAEDALMRSIAYSHWARDPLGRLTAYMYLAHVEQQLHFPNEAVRAMFLALDRAEAIALASPMAAEARPRIAEGLARYLEELGDAPRAAAVRTRAAQWMEPPHSDADSLPA